MSVRGVWLWGLSSNVGLLPVRRCEAAFPQFYTTFCNSVVSRVHILSSAALITYLHVGWSHWQSVRRVSAFGGYEVIFQIRHLWCNCLPWYSITTKSAKFNLVSLSVSRVHIVVTIDQLPLEQRSLIDSQTMCFLHIQVFKYIFQLFIKRGID